MEVEDPLNLAHDLLPGGVQENHPEGAQHRGRGSQQPAVGPDEPVQDCGQGPGRRVDIRGLAHGVPQLDSSTTYWNTL